MTSIHPCLLRKQKSYLGIVLIYEIRLVPLGWYKTCGYFKFPTNLKGQGFRLF
jgi:hypothetical protein